MALLKQKSQQTDQDYARQISLAQQSLADHKQRLVEAQQELNDADKKIKNAQAHLDCANKQKKKPSSSKDTAAGLGAYEDLKNACIGFARKCSTDMPPPACADLIRRTSNNNGWEAAEDNYNAKAAQAAINKSVDDTYAPMGLPPDKPNNKTKPAPGTAK